MGKKINVFRKNDVEHLKAYLIETVREVVEAALDEKEGPFGTTQSMPTPREKDLYSGTGDPDEIVARLDDRVKEIIQLFLKVMASAEVKELLPDKYEAAEAIRPTTVPNTATGQLGLEKSLELGVPHKDVNISGFSGNLRSYVWKKLKDKINDQYSVEFFPSTEADVRYGEMAGKFQFQDLALTFQGSGTHVAAGGEKEKGGGRTFATLKVEMAKGAGSELDPNRGELAEAWMALAVTKRFMNLPSTATTGPEGEVTPAKGLVSSKEVVEFLQTGGVTLEKDGLHFEGKAGLDTIIMDVQLRGHSLKGLVSQEEGGLKIGNFASTDSESKAFLEGAVKYANKEILPWAVGVVQAATKGEELAKMAKAGENPKHKALGWFINDVKNTIRIAAVGTEAQSLTKVDLEMTCKEAAQCPLSFIKGGAGAIESQLARLSLKAGTIPHFGGGTATTIENAIGVMESVFPGFEKAASGEVEGWKNDPATQVAFGDTGSTKLRMPRIHELVKLYMKHVASMLANNPVGKDGPWINELIKGLKQHAVGGKKGKVKKSDTPQSAMNKDFSGEEGVLMVQVTTDGDFFTLDFNKLDDAFVNFDFSAVTTGAAGAVPYLTVYATQVANEDGKRIKMKPPTNKNEEHVLFTMRGLGREGGEILRLEKGELMKTLLKVDQKEQVVYRDGKMTVVDETDMKEQTLEDKVLAILKESLKIS